jgi:hypothetical protein
MKRMFVAAIAALTLIAGSAVAAPLQLKAPNASKPGCRGYKVPSGDFFTYQGKFVTPNPSACPNNGKWVRGVARGNTITIGGNTFQLDASGRAQ